MNEYSHNPKIAELLPERNKQAIIKMANKLGLKLRRGGSLVKSRYFEELTPQSAYIAADDIHVTTNKKTLVYGLKL